MQIEGRNAGLALQRKHSTSEPSLSLNQGLMLVLLLQDTGIDMTLNNATAMMTVFVPINSAFDAVATQMNTTLNAIMAQKDAVMQVCLKFQATRRGSPVSAISCSCCLSLLVDSSFCRTTITGRHLKAQCGKL